MVRIIVLLLAGGLAVTGLLRDSVFLLPLAALMAGLALGIQANQPKPTTANSGWLHILQGERWALLLVGALFVSFAAGWVDQTYPAHWGGLLLWLAGFALVGLAVYWHDRGVRKRETHTLPRIAIFDLAQWEWLVILAITGVALWLRFYRLNEMLPFYHGDEGELGMCGLQARFGTLEEFGAKPLPFFATSCFRMPNGFYYLQAIALWLSGALGGSQAMITLRMLSATFGALCVPLVYLIGRLGWGKIAGGVAASLIAVSHLYIHYSRMALNNIQSAWFALFSALMLVALYVQAQKRHTASELIAAEQPAGESVINPFIPASGFNPLPTTSIGNGGLWGRMGTRWASARPTPPTNAPVGLCAWLGTGVGLSLYFYFGSQLIPLITAPLLLWLWWKNSVNWKQLFVVFAAFLVAFAPLLLHYAQVSEALTGRTETVFLLSDRTLIGYLGPDYSWLRDVPALLWKQTTNLTRLFIDRGDISSFYTAETAGLDWITAGLFWLGLGIVLTRWLRYPESVLLLWFVAGCTLAGILTRDAPTVTRLIVALPPAYLLAGIALQSIIGQFMASFTLNRILAPLIVVSVVATAGWLNYTAYFNKYAHIMAYTAPGRIATQVEELDEAAQVFLIGAPRLFVMHGVLRFITHGTEFYDLKSVADLETVQQEHPTESTELLFIILPDNSAEIGALQIRFPNALLEEHHDNLGRLLYLSYHVLHG